MATKSKLTYSETATYEGSKAHRFIKLYYIPQTRAHKNDVIINSTTETLHINFEHFVQ